MKKTLLSLTILFVLSVFFSCSTTSDVEMNQEEIPEVAETVFSASEEKENRNPYDLILAIDEESYYEWAIPELPYFIDDMILQLYANESIFIEVDNTGTVINGMKVVEENVNPEKTLEVSFYQVPEKGNERIHDYMVLDIVNPLGYDLNYECIMYDLMSGSWYETDVYPVMAGLRSSEIWPDILISLVLQNFSLSEPLLQKN